MTRARTNAMMTSPGTSPRNPRKPCRVFSLLGSGSSSELRSAVFTAQAYRSASSLDVPAGRVSRQHERDLHRLERGPNGSAFTEPEPVDRAERDLGDNRRLAGQADPGALALDRDLGDAALQHVARGSLG